MDGMCRELKAICYLLLQLIKGAMVEDGQKKLVRIRSWGGPHAILSDLDFVL